MRNVLGLLTVALLVFGCSSKSAHNILGPGSTEALQASSGTMPDAGLSSDRPTAEQDRGKKGRDGDKRDKDGDRRDKDGDRRDKDGDRRDKDGDGRDRDDDNEGGGGGGGSSGPGSGIIGGAAGFAVFAASTITNTGPSVVNGDIGLTPGTAVTGFPPGTLTGIIHINDAAANQAKLVLQAAYGVLVGLPCNTVAPVLDGTLTPGVYCFPSSAQLNTTLVLDGQGNPNALFIFQIGSTLTTASNSSVTLINGASASNVFWQVGSSATLGTNTAFQGTIIAQTSITMTTGASILNGRAIALNGAVTMDTNLVTAPAGGSGGGGGGGGGNGGGGKHDDDDDEGKGNRDRDRDRDRDGDRSRDRDRDRDRDHDREGRGGRGGRGGD